jgi:serine/threonine protein kinase/WD40 repeat protein
MNAASTHPHQSERDLFLEALERPTPSERAAFLDQACAQDPALRAAVEALLQNHQQDDFLKSPVAVASSGDGGTEVLGVVGERCGDRIDRYKLLQQVGEGGAGVVFMAEQESPVRRRVALKVLKPGVDTKSVIARFEAERQALALMDHPNIAKVLDAGSTATGRPYFVMELVRGVRITDYCDENRLPTRERLALFIQVCQAIQHAHQKGIIHRDIKPSNILVTLHDGVAVPKVIDFGIAKAVDQRLTEKTFFTEFQSFIGTPAYVSPEQAEMSGLDIDTRADIYSLGVLLYELLTGRTPFDAQELWASGLDGMRRTIREREPSPPSTRLRALPEAEQTTTAQRQRLEPAKLTSLLRGDLDWIVLKALEKDRTRRYETANGLAQDVRRHLGNEPISARPPTAAYRFQKLARRNKLVFAGAGALAAALLIGLALSTWQFLEKSAAYRRAARAEQEQSRLRLAAETAGQLAVAQALVARRQAYAADMNLAQAALAANNLGRAQELLNRHRPDGKSQISDFKSQIPVDLRGWEWRYLWQQCQSEALFTLCQLSNEVSALSVSPDDKWVAIGESGGGGISIWDLRARQEVARFPAEEAGELLVFSPTAPVLAFSAMDRRSRSGPRNAGGLVRLWDAANRRIVRDIPVNGAFSVLAFSADGSRLLTADGNTEVSIWNVAEGTKLNGINLPDAGPAGRPLPWGNSAAVTPDFRLMAQSLGGGHIRVVDLTSGQELWKVQAADENVTALAFSPDGRMLASGAGFVESAVRLWGVASGRELARLEGHRTYVRSLVFWPDGGTLASASGDQTIHLWDIGALGAISSTSESQPRRPTQQRPPELHPYATLRGHRLEVWSLALCPDHTTLVSGAKDGTVCVWDTAAVRREHTHVTLPVPVPVWALPLEGRGILTVERQGRVARWHGAGFQQCEPLLEVRANVLSGCFSEDERFLAVVTLGGGSQVWDLQRGERINDVAPKEGWGLLVAFIAPSNHLLTQQMRDGSLREWDVTSGREVRRWPAAFSRPPGKRALSAGGQWFATVGGEGRTEMLHLATGQARRFAMPLKQVSEVALSPDGRLLAAASVLGAGELWDTAAGRRMATLQGFLQGTHSVAFSPDSQRLTVGSNGNEAVKLWDSESFQELLTLSGQGSMFNPTAFSPDGNVLASRNSQGILHVWRAPSFEEIARREAERGN